MARRSLPGIGAKVLEGTDEAISCSQDRGFQALAERNIAALKDSLLLSRPGERKAGTVLLLFGIPGDDGHRA